MKTLAIRSDFDFNYELFSVQGGKKNVFQGVLGIYFFASKTENAS